MRNLLFLLTAFLVFPVAVAAAEETEDDSYQEALRLYEARKFEEAAPILERLARQGNSHAQAKLGEVYDYGYGVPEDDIKAIEWYGKAAEGGNSTAAIEGVYLMYKEASDIGNFDKAALMLEAMLDTPDNVEALHKDRGDNIGISILEDVETDVWGAYRNREYKQTMLLAEVLAARDSAFGQWVLGLMHANGYGFPKDDAKALEWLLRSAQQGYSNAIIDLRLPYYGNYKEFLDAGKYERAASILGEVREIEGDLILRGLLPQEASRMVYFESAYSLELLRAMELEGYDKVLRLATAFAEAGQAFAQEQLGRMYANGDGVLEDDVQAVEWLRKAADQGLTSAQFRLGIMYDIGESMPEDDAQAVNWYRMAAEQGDVGAQFNLGVMYNNGEGVTEDYVQAYAWLNIAATRGNASAASYKRDVRERMTEQQTNEAQTLSREYWNKHVVPFQD